MSSDARRRVLPFALLAPLGAVPLLTWLLMEFGPERSFVFAGYLLVWAVAFLVAGVVVAKRQPSASATVVLARAATSALLILAMVFAALFALSFVLVPRTP